MWGESCKVSLSELHVNMLGEFSLASGGAEINDGANRSRKIWLLLAYIIYNRNRPVAPEELYTLLWEEEESSSNPGNALKTMFHRLRNLLNELDPHGGRDLIVRREGAYAWNTEVPLTLDIDRFDQLAQTGLKAKDPTKKLDHYMEALSLYRGDFLDKMPSETWVVPISAYYHNLYVQMALEALPLLEERERWTDMTQLCRNVLAQEPYMEGIYCHLMNALLRQGEFQKAVKVYESMSELLLSSFGIMPSDKARNLYREAIRTVNDRTVSSGFILEQLRESSAAQGALICDYDIFKVIYHSVTRSVGRSGDAVHLALISVDGEDGSPLSRRSLDRVVENLQDLIRSCLRRGDVVSRCSVSQFIMLLPHANYENSRMICERIVKAFRRAYPHSPALLHTSIHPLEPN